MAAGGQYFDRAYFAWQGERAERSARAVAPLVLDLLAPESVVDVGCGTGAWLEVFAEHGLDVFGIDGYQPEGDLRVPVEAFQRQDLSRPSALGRTFDLALSLEVAHYLPELSAPAFVGFLTSLAPCVLFGAAVPGQGGGPGLNRRWPSYWSALFEENGFACSDWLRPRVWEDDDVDWWYAQNTLVYVRRDRAERLPGLTPTPLALVHPGLLQETRAAGASDNGLVGRLRRALRR